MSDTVRPRNLKEDTLSTDSALIHSVAWFVDLRKSSLMFKARLCSVHHPARRSTSILCRVCRGCTVVDLVHNPGYWHRYWCRGDMLACFHTLSGWLKSPVSSCVVSCSVQGCSFSMSIFGRMVLKAELKSIKSSLALVFLCSRCSSRVWNTVATASSADPFSQGCFV